MLISNALFAREIIIGESGIIFKNRFGQREVKISEIIGIRFSREKKRLNEEKSEVRIVKMKLQKRKRLMRIRLNDFQDEKELAGEFRQISKKILTRNP